MDRKTSETPDQLRRQIADLQAKQQKQRNEIGRLQKAVEDLEADKRNLKADLVMARKRAEQLAAIIQGGVA